MATIEERAREYADNFVAGDSAIIVALLHKVAEESYLKGATEQEAIDEDAIHAIVEEQVLKAIEKQKAIDDRAKEEILNADSKRISRLLQRREYMVAKACECFELAEDWQAWANGDFEYAKSYFRKVLEEGTK